MCSSDLALQLCQESPKPGLVIRVLKLRHQKVMRELKEINQKDSGEFMVIDTSSDFLRKDFEKSSSELILSDGSNKSLTIKTHSNALIEVLPHLLNWLK